MVALLLLCLVAETAVGIILGGLIMATVSELDAKVDEVAASQSAVIERLEAIIAQLENDGGINPADLDPIILKLQAIKDAADSHRP